MIVDDGEKEDKRFLLQDSDIINKQDSLQLAKFTISNLLNDIINQFSNSQKKDNLLESDFYDNISILDRKINSQCLNNIINIKFFKTIEQHSKNLCGFHSLYNIIIFVSYYKLKIESQENSTSLNKAYNKLQEINSIVDYWRFHKHCVKEIIENVYLEEHSKKELINDGPLERFMFKYLIEESRLLGKVFSTTDLDIKTNNIDNKNKDLLNIDLDYFFYAYGHIQVYHSDDSRILQQKITNFVKSTSKYNLLVLVLGITNHWSVMILEKNSFINNNNSIEFNYFDSKQIHEVFTLDNNKNINEFIQRREEHKLKFKIKQASEWHLSVFKQWFSDIHSTVSHVYNLVNETTYLEIINIENTILNIVSSFKQHCEIDLDYVKYNKNEYNKDNKDNRCNKEDKISKAHLIISDIEYFVNNYNSNISNIDNNYLNDFFYNNLVKPEQENDISITSYNSVIIKERIIKLLLWFKNHYSPLIIKKDLIDNIRKHNITLKNYSKVNLLREGIIIISFIRSVFEDKRYTKTLIEAKKSFLSKYNLNETVMIDFQRYLKLLFMNFDLMIEDIQKAKKREH